MFGSGFRFRRIPNVAFVGAPISLSWAMSSPLTSRHVRMSVDDTLGLYVFEKPVASCWVYLPMLVLIAVRPSPNRS